MALAVGLFLLLALGRAWHHLFGVPYLYMEQATVYYKYAFEHRWLESLLAPHQGYYNFWINFVAAVAAKMLPMEWAPYAMTMGGTLVGAVVAGLLFAPGSPVKGFGFQLLALVVMIFIPPAEDRFSITYSHFYMAVAAVLVAASEATSRREALWQRRVLAFAVLCGPVACFALPVFLLCYWQEKKRERLVQAGILGVGVLVQLGWLWFALAHGSGALLNESKGSRFEGLGQFDIFVFWLYERLLVYPFTSWKRFFDGGNWLMRQEGNARIVAVVMCAISMVGWSAAALGQHRRVAGRIVAAIFCISLGNFFASVVPGADKSALINSTHRYFIAQAMLVGLVFVYQLSVSRGRARVFYALVVAWMLVAGVRIWLEWSATMDAPVSWAEEVATWRINHHYGLRIMPRGHSVWLSGEGR